MALGTTSGNQWATYPGLTDNSSWRPLTVAYDDKFDSYIKSQLKSLKKLPQNWDGEGAPTIDEEIILASSALVLGLPKWLRVKPKVVPLASGGLQFEWHKENRCLELELETSLTVHYLKWDPEKEIEEEAIFDITDLTQAEDLVRWFVESAALHD